MAEAGRLLSGGVLLESVLLAKLLAGVDMLLPPREMVRMYS